MNEPWNVVDGVPLARSDIEYAMSLPFYKAFMRAINDQLASLDVLRDVPEIAYGIERHYAGQKVAYARVKQIPDLMIQGLEQHEKEANNA